MNRLPFKMKLDDLVISKKPSFGKNLMAKNSFFKHILNGRWFSIYFYSLILAGSGGTYLYPLYSGELKEKFSYDQKNINIFSIFKDTGASFGLLSEFVVESSPEWCVLVLANLANFVSYLLLWFSLEGRSDQKKSSTWVFRCIFFFLGWSKSMHKVLCSRNSSSRFVKVNKGLQSVTLTSFMKIGACMMILFIATFSKGSSHIILLFLSVVPTILCILSSLYFTKNLEIQSLDKQTENLLYSSFLVHATCVGFMLVVGSVALQNGALTAGIALPLLLLSPLLTSFGSEVVAWRRLREKGSTTATATEDHQKTEEQEKSEKNNRRLMIIKFILVGFATNVAVGSTVTTIDQVGQISEALALNQIALRKLLQVLLVFSLVGRLFTRILYGLSNKFSVPPGVLGVLWGCLLCLTHLSIAFPFNTGKTIYFSCILIGLCHGGQLQLASMALHDLFKKKSIFFYQIMKLMIPAFTFIFKALVVSPIYLKEAKTELVCLGKQCFQDSFLVLSISVGATIVMWIILIKMDSQSQKMEEIQIGSSSVHVKARTSTT